ncbi:MAG: hypothetical protein KatS3mg111_3850 [Pirellulaceae bacterium]|nr:MAG: hypothetical protein KatS3mg111_3850 [Pirellulaceae bacterium]
MIRTTALLVTLLWGGAVLLGNSAVVIAQTTDFRIETDVLEDGHARPVVQTLTLFQDGIAYDFTRGDEDNCVLVDPQRDRIVLMNSKHQLRTEVSINEMKHLIESARTQAAGTSLAVFLIGASKTEVVDGVVKVGDEHLHYQATTQRVSHPGVATLYQEFADSMARLNAWASAGTPPFARLALNQAVADLNALPVEIRRSMKVGGKTLVHISRLHPTWLLSKSDRLKISEAQKGLVAFTQVDYATFQSRTRAINNEVASGN